MPRFTDTRAKVRALADAALARGEEPSPTAILRDLGRGSASTVVDELRKWRAVRRPRAAEPGLAQAGASTQSSEPAPVGPPPGWDDLREALGRLEAKVLETDVRHGEREALALERLTAVQKMALMSIEEAREQTRFWKQAAQQARDDASVKADAYRQAMLAAQSESRRLSDRVRELEAALEALRTSTRVAGRLGANSAAPGRPFALATVRPVALAGRAAAHTVDPDGPTE